MSFSIRRSLQAVMFALAFFGAVGGGIAIYTIRQLTAAIHDTSNEHVRPLMLLKAIADAYAVTIVDTTHKTAAQTMTWDEGIKSVKESEAIIIESWGSFRKKPLATDEKTIADEYNAMMAKAAPFLAKIVKTMETKDQAGLRQIAAAELYPVIDPLTEKIDGLMKYQLKAIDSKMESAERDGAFAVAVQIFGGGFLLVLMGVGLFFVARKVVGPLMGLRDKMAALAAGDVGIELRETAANNEIGEMARAVSAFQQNEIERRRLESETRAERSAERSRQESIETLIATFGRIMSSVRQTFNAEFGTMRDTSGSLMGIASQATNGMGAAREAADFSTSNLDTVGRAATELTAASREISQQVHKTSERVKVAMDAARQTDKDISGLAELGGRIGAIVGLINSIAEQTNMLALNATIEAARAGDAGRSFAVVAAEVKNLADQTARATEEISQQISAIQSATDNAVTSLQAITFTVSEIEAQTTAIAAAVEEQEASTHEIARSISAASEGSAQAASNVNVAKASIDRTGDQANRLAGISDKLGKAAEGLSSASEQLLADLGRDLEARRAESRRQLRQLIVIDRHGRRHPSTIVSTASGTLNIAPVKEVQQGQPVTLEFSNGERRNAKAGRCDATQQMVLDSALEAGLVALVA